MFCYFGAMRDFSSNETPHFPARLLSLFFVVKNRGKRIKTNQQTLEISGVFRFAFIIVYGHIFATVALQNGIDVKTVSAILGISEYYMKKGKLPVPGHYQFCLGVLGGMPATVENLMYMVNHIPAGSTWSAFGVGKGHMPILYAALALGGHIRVGLEDNVVYGFDKDGKKIMATNMMLVERAVKAVETFGNQVATPAEARQILASPSWILIKFARSLV